MQTQIILTYGQFVLVQGRVVQKSILDLFPAGTFYLGHVRLGC